VSSLNKVCVVKMKNMLEAAAAAGITDEPLSFDISEG